MSAQWHEPEQTRSARRVQRRQVSRVKRQQERQERTGVRGGAGAGSVDEKHGHLLNRRDSETQAAAQLGYGVCEDASRWSCFSFAGCADPSRAHSQDR